MNKIDVQKYDSYNREIIRFVPKDSYVLDVGCNTGKLAQQLQEKGCEVVGIDLDKELLKKADKFCKKTHLVNVDNLQDLANKIKGEKFDAIILGDVLEHLKRPQDLLQALKSYLKKDGVIVASIPNAAFIWLRFRFLVGNYRYSETGGLMDEDHLRFFSFTTAKELFKNEGYSIKIALPSSHGIVNPVLSPVKALAKALPNLFAIHILIVATK